MFTRIRRSWLSRFVMLALALGMLASFSGLGHADVKTQKTDFELTVNDFKEIFFTPGAAGNININVEWRVKGLGALTGKDVPLQVELFRPGQSTPVDKVQA